jgi:hypothetical protein
MSRDSSASSGLEYYIRGQHDTEARGPFTAEQLASLTESSDPAKSVTPETFYYDNVTDQWATIGSHAELKATLWPEKKKLGFKQKDFKVINIEQADSAAPITVQDFLAAAEGKTKETKGKADRSIAMMNAAQWGTRSAALICLLSAVALLLPSIEVVLALDWAKLGSQPFILLGLVDAFIGLLLLLGVISIYPFIRFRAAFGLGFLGVVFIAQNQYAPALAIAAGSLGLYFSTIFLSYIPLALAALLGVGGMALLTTMAYL